MENPRVFFDINIRGEDVGRIVMELAADVVPRTAGNATLTSSIVCTRFVVVTAYS